MTVKIESKTKVKEVKKTVKKADSLIAHVVDTAGKAAGTIQLPSELFGAKVNKNILAQAVRVYQANQRSGSASVKTRGQVEGSTRKIYKQKGTGKARHGGIRAPIFVGGGIVFGPTPRDYSLQMPKKMKFAALASALTHVYQQGLITFVDGIAAIPAKTKQVATSLKALGIVGNSSVLLVISKDADVITRSSRNIQGLDVLPIFNLHPYTLLSHKKIIFMKEAVSEGVSRFVKKV